VPDLSVLGFGPRGWGEALLWGALLTVEIALASYLLGLAIGLLGVWAKLAGPRPVRALAGLYTTVMRGVPDILVILLVYYGGTSAVRSLVGLVSPGVIIEINAFAAAVASLGVIAGAYATEVFRGSIQAIPAGQFDAVRALSLPRIVGFRRVILPQALRLALATARQSLARGDEGCGAHQRGRPARPAGRRLLGRLDDPDAVHLLRLRGARVPGPLNRVDGRPPPRRARRRARPSRHGGVSARR
jgi:His/Glu/Gln/Arg/opine family amino acid ABC transporter permease subunit